MSIAQRNDIEDLKQRVTALEMALHALAERIGPVASERVNKTLKLPEKRKPNG